LPLVTKHIFALFRFVSHRLDVLNQQRGTGIHHRVELLLTHLKHGLQDIINEIPEEAYLATLLDPRYFDTFIPVNLRAGKWARLQELVDSLQADAGADAARGKAVMEEAAVIVDEPPEARAGTRGRPSAAPKKKTFDEIIREMKEAKGGEQAQQRPYHELAPINEKLDPAHWWRQHESIYPFHARLARRYLAVPATSAPSERVFSTGGRVLEKRRAALKPECVRAIVLVHDHIDKLEDVVLEQGNFDD
jgi:hypothetical protein